MYILYGCYDEYSPNAWNGDSYTEHIKDPIAKFSTIELAQEYSKSCLLKTERRESFRTPYKFKRRTLLSRYSWTEIEEEVETDLPIDPEPMK